jgi:hypothetical protein
VPANVSFGMMPDNLDPDVFLGPGRGEQDDLRLLSRSPHPYHHQTADLLHPSDRLLRRTSSAASKSDGPKDGHSPFTSFSKESSPTSDSGTDADDEHFLKGLPAPRVRLHKGLRGRNEPLSGTSTPLLSPALLEEEGRNDAQKLKRARPALEGWYNPENFRRAKVLVRRSLEGTIVASLWLMLWTNKEVRSAVVEWQKGRQTTRAATVPILWC